MALSTECNTMLSVKKAGGFNSKNLNGRKCSSESSGEDNYNPNAKKFKNSSEDYVTKCNNMVSLMNKQNTPSEDKSPLSPVNDTIGSFCCRKCSSWLRNCAACICFMCVNCEVKCVSCSEKSNAHAQLQEITKSKGIVTRTKEIPKTVSKIISCLCGFSTRKNEAFKCHKLFDFKIPIKVARVENISKGSKHTINKIDKLFGGICIQF